MAGSENHGWLSWSDGSIVILSVVRELKKRGEPDGVATAGPNVTLDLGFFALG